MLLPLRSHNLPVLPCGCVHCTDSTDSQYVIACLAYGLLHIFLTELPPERMTLTSVCATRAAHEMLCIG